MLQKLLRPLDKEVPIKFQCNVSNGKSKSSFNPLSSYGNRRFKSQVLAAGLEYEHTGCISALMKEESRYTNYSCQNILINSI